MGEEPGILDKKFFDLVGVASTLKAMQDGKVVAPFLREIAMGVVATSSIGYFYDPKRWKLRKKLSKDQKIDPKALIVRVPCDDREDVDDVADCARAELVALQGDEWKEGKEDIE